MVEVLPAALSHHNNTSHHHDSPVTDVSRVAAATVAARLLLGASVASRPENKMMTREEHAAMMHELNKKRAGWRTPRRGWSYTDSPAVGTTLASSPSAAASSPLAHDNQSAEPVERSYRLIPDRAPPVRQPGPQEPVEPVPPAPAERPSRPKPPPPRRSYSVMDYEPAPPTHRPSSRMVITDLPSEIHFAIFDFLDPIDSTCLGLANKHFYAIHRRMHGSVALSSRREGPNDLEWAWRGAGPLVRAKTAGNLAAGTGQDEAARERLRVKGQVYCRKCGISRCELHRHLREWMASAGKPYEYCAVTAKYGPPAPEDAKEFCYLRSPKRPHRCGRHSARSTGTLTPQEQRPKLQS